MLQKTSLLSRNDALAALETALVTICRDLATLEVSPPIDTTLAL